MIIISHQSNTISNPVVTIQPTRDSVSRQSDGIITNEWTDITPDHPFGKIIIIFDDQSDCQINISQY